MINKERGYWIGDLPSEHKYDRVLSKKLVEVLRSKNVETIIDLGCGLGLYTEHFITEAFKCIFFICNWNSLPLFAISNDNNSTNC